MRFSSLGSGSDGNALVVEGSEGSTTTRVLLDCGFSMREAVRRLERAALTPDQLQGILITHEHSDHIGGALSLARKTGLPVYMSWGTALATRAVDAKVDLRIIEAGEALRIGDLDVHPYTVPHDAREPLQFTFSDGARRLGVLTDVGIGTPHIVETLSRCDALILECNHDREMLSNGRYPPMLKARIGGSHGHLANDAAAEILAALAHGALRHVVAAHLSAENNQAGLAQAALAGALGAHAGDILVASQADGFDWLSIA
ncbi:MBL fold metallo-hydrolase [Chitinasiproducens palmae]|uniref:Phosphoribosyl 1,2-cyclic phosphodiesterase n=1 Tax=Chitinasiproducens palmae TaxID=1770053 RepID=A0A1H2PR10_9BURK|nr:MBL fold metallo-hydrolase [Chitinasiproducens palmae]SDV49307.1 Phosphoribosyl 1,2-cyclic phosphodiesterase [Chitinasiproducens palmae]